MDWEHVNEKYLKAYDKPMNFEELGNIKINIAIIGNAGVGKSSLANAVRGLEDDDELAAETGITECKSHAMGYLHPTNDKIKFWVLPGIGTPKYPDLQTYCEKVDLEEYDTFLILTATRFTQNDLDLAKKVKSMKKSLFFIRTKIDQDYANSKRKKRFNEEAMLKAIMADCLRNLEGLRDGDEDVFLISNHHPTKWDFPRLTQAILDVLPLRQREALILSSTSRSKDMLKSKAKILRGRIWKVASASAAGAVFPVAGVSVVADFALALSEVSLYRRQLGLPDENTLDFQKMTPEKQEIIRRFCFSCLMQLLAMLFKKYFVRSAVEEYSRFIPLIGSVIAGVISFKSTYSFLNECLDNIESMALSLPDQLETNAMYNFDIDI